MHPYILFVLLTFAESSFLVMVLLVDTIMASAFVQKYDHT